MELKSGDKVYLVITEEDYDGNLSDFAVEEIQVFVQKEDDESERYFKVRAGYLERVLEQDIYLTKEDIRNKYQARITDFIDYLDGEKNAIDEKISMLRSILSILIDGTKPDQDIEQIKKEWT